jgi:large subunit ribosomal protein L6
MSRVAKDPVVVPKGVEIDITENSITAKGPKGQLEMAKTALVDIRFEDGQITFSANDGSSEARAMAGTTRALANNLVSGVIAGFERKLTVIGIGYRAKAQGKKLNLTLGFSHPVVFDVPAGINIETPSQTEIVISGADKQQVGQTAAEIRRYRPPEPYKGKGIRYSDEHVVRKQAKKK